MSKPKEAMYDLSDVVIDTRYQKFLSEAINRKCLHDAIIAVGLMHVERSLLNHKKCVELQRHYNHFSSRCDKSDLLAEIDIYMSVLTHKFENLKEEGIDGQVYSKVKKFVLNLRHKLKKKGYDVNARTDDDDQFIICLIKGMDDLLMECLAMGAIYKDEHYTDLYVSYMFNSFNPYKMEWCIGIPQSFITAKGKRKQLCLFKTIFSTEMLIQYGDADKLHRKNTFYTFNVDTESIEIVTQLYYGSLMLNYKHIIYRTDDEDYDKMCETYREQIQQRIQDVKNREYMLKNEYMFTGNTTSDTKKTYASIEVPATNPDMMKALEEAGFKVGE